MKKLLPERLREFANTLKYDDVTGLFKSPDGGFKYRLIMFPGEALELADEIERFYIPRPRFEDGEPVQDSDIEEIGGMATCCVYMDGSWVFEPDKYEDTATPKQWDRQSGTISDRIKRPQPKVLDADGVEIRVGDMVWRTSGHYPWRVDKITTDGRVGILDDDGLGDYADPKKLTHKEPDSLEKLRDDMGSKYADNGIICLGQFIDRLSALIERGA